MVLGYTCGGNTVRLPFVVLLVTAGMWLAVFGLVRAAASCPSLTLKLVAAAAVLAALWATRRIADV